MRQPEEFWARVGPPERGGCRLWQGGKASKVRGESSRGTCMWRGKIQDPRKVAFELLNKRPARADRFVITTCDKPLCMTHVIECTGKKYRCTCGHPFDQIYGGRRVCSRCNKRRSRERYEKLKEKK